MSTEMSAIKVAGLMAAAVAVGTAYVLVHEHRRKGKKERKALEVAAGGSSSEEDRRMGAERLIEIMGELANAAYQLIEQVCSCTAAARGRHFHRDLVQCGQRASARLCVPCVPACLP